MLTAQFLVPVHVSPELLSYTLPVSVGYMYGMKVGRLIPSLNLLLKSLRLFCRKFILYS